MINQITPEQAQAYAGFILAAEDPEFRCNPDTEEYANSLQQYLPKPIRVVVDVDAPPGRLYIIDKAAMDRARPVFEQLKELYLDPSVVLGGESPAV